VLLSLLLLLLLLHLLLMVKMTITIVVATLLPYQRYTWMSQLATTRTMTMLLTRMHRARWTRVHAPVYRFFPTLSTLWCDKFGVMNLKVLLGDRLVSSCVHACGVVLPLVF